MRILFVITDVSPFNPKQGAEQRTCLLLKSCIKAGNVDVIDFCEDNVGDSLGARLLYVKSHNTNAYWANTRKDKIKRLLTSFLPGHMTAIDKTKEQIIDYFYQRKKYDYIVTRYALPAVNCGLYKYADKLVVDVDDNASEKIKIIGKTALSRNTALFFSFYARNISFSMKFFNKRVHTVFYSNPDDCKSSHSILLPNVPFYERATNSLKKSTVSNRLLFVGDMTYNPNIEAVDGFLHSSYKTIINCRNNVSFHIVGKCLDSKKSEWETFQGVKVTGFVPSIEQEYAEASVFILPMYCGAGTCIKFLEAIQMNTPVVTTDCGFRGYSHFFIPNEDCCIANDERAFSRIVIELLDDKNKRDAIAESAGKKIKGFYSRKYFEEVVINALSKH